MSEPRVFAEALSLDIATLTGGYRSGALQPSSVLDEICARITRHDDPAVWIDLFSRDQMQSQLATALDRQAGGIAQPLLGIPFAAKDNMDVAGHVTTAGCPEFGYEATTTALAIRRLQDLGAILVGKTNLDQFAAGLVGTRSPYGVCRNLFDKRYVPGGSSTGSAIAVSAGLVSFALGTDTAGSGRVPAAFNNIVGLKASRGLISCQGVVPACKSLDCVSLFTLTCADARLLFSCCAIPDPSDCFSRSLDQIRAAGWSRDRFRVGVPREEDLQFFGDPQWAGLYRSALDRVRSMGGEAVSIDYRPLARAASLLYTGPWLAERAMVMKELLEHKPRALLEVTRSILERGRKMDAAAVFDGLYALSDCAQQMRRQWSAVDVLLLPTAPTIYTTAQIQKDPVQLNSNLGYYTNFVNLLDLSAVAVPSAIDARGLPFGVTFIAPAGNELGLLELAERYHAATELPLGATGLPQPSGSPTPLTKGEDGMLIAVVGAHLFGQPLNGQLAERGGVLVTSCKTAAKYRLYALPATTPPKPGLVRVQDQSGGAIEVEVWRLPLAEVGSFLALVAPPLGIGTIELEDGRWVKGFICEGYATTGARDITAMGGWRAFLSQK